MSHTDDRRQQVFSVWETVFQDLVEVVEEKFKKNYGRNDECLCKDQIVECAKIASRLVEKIA
jgi:hypothetical protein